MVLFSNLCKMARFLNKNTLKVKNYMKKNFCKILEIHLRVIWSLLNPSKNKETKKLNKIMMQS